MLLENLKPFIDWLHLHPDWANFFVFLIAFGESIAIFGLLVPGSVVMTAIGALVGAGILPMYPIIASAIAGAVLGDVFSFWLGSCLHQNVRNYWPFTRFPQVLIKGEAFFQRHGKKSVFLGRFVGPIRPVIPLIAGMLNMKPARFFMADIPAAIAWAPVYMLPGILLGQLSLQLQPEVATQFLLVIFSTLIILWLIYWLLKRLILGFIHSARYLLTYLWQRFSLSQPWMKFMQTPGHPQDASQFRSFIFAWFLLALLGLSIYSVIHQGFLIGLNNPIFHFMRSLRNPHTDQVMNLITFMGVKEVMFAISVVVSLYFVAKRNFWVLAHWMVLNVVTFGSIYFIKNWVQSPRPGTLFFSPYGWSFPSGHTTLILVILGFLAAVTTEKASPLIRRWVYGLVGFLVVAVGISRLYLGFHWFSDVLGAILLGLFLLIATLFSYRTRKSAEIIGKPLWVIVILTGTFAWGVYAFQHLDENLKTSVAYWPMQMVSEKNWWSKSKVDPVLYRTNRFGKPVQLINIEWSGDLNKIKEALTAHGWKLPDKPDLAMIVTSFTNQGKSNLNPIFLTRYHRDRKPALVMTKVVPGQRQLLIIRLWNSHIMLKKSGYTLWVGTINYYRPWPTLRHHSSHSAPKILPIDLLKKDLGDFLWKELSHPNAAQQDIDKGLDSPGYVLLIHSK